MSGRPPIAPKRANNNAAATANANGIKTRVRNGIEMNTISSSNENNTGGGNPSGSSGASSSVSSSIVVGIVSLMFLAIFLVLQRVNSTPISPKHSVSDDSTPATLRSSITSSLSSSAKKSSKDDLPSSNSEGNSEGGKSSSTTASRDDANKAAAGGGGGSASPVGPVVWAKGSWARFAMRPESPFLGMPGPLLLSSSSSSSSSGAKKEQQRRKDPKKPPFCKPFPAIDGLAAQCDLQAISVALAAASSSSSSSVFPLLFDIELVEGIRIHRATCLAGCSRVSIAASSSATAGAGVNEGDFEAPPTRKGGRTTATTTVTLAISSNEDLSGQCASLDASSCIISFDMLVSYDGYYSKIKEGNSGGGEGRGGGGGGGGGASSSRMSRGGYSQFPPMCFLSIGDWGNPSVQSVADQMAIDAEKSFAKFIISTGDNFYPTGVKSLNDPHWEKSFEKPFSSPFVKYVRWFISAGNHDQWGLPPQLEYGRTHPRWYFPAPYYNDEVPIYAEHTSEKNSDAEKLSSASTTSKSTSLFLTALDYNGRHKDKQLLFLDNVHTDKYKEISGVSSIENRNEENNNDGGGSGSSSNNEAIKKFLWRGVINHPLLFGGSGHGQQGETTTNRAQLKPILDKHKIHFHLSGHDHILEVLKSDHTDYLISGAGGGSKMYTSTKIKETVWYQGDGVTMRGFMRHCVFGHDRMETTLVDDKGKEHYTHVTLFNN